MEHASSQEEQQVQEFWRSEYSLQLEQRLEASVAFLSREPLSKVRAHIRSFLTLLVEAHHFPALNNHALALISRLHPYPLRWGLGHLWEVELRFALAHTPTERTDLIAEYKCSLGELYQFRGEFDKAIAEVREVFDDPSAGLLHSVNACRTLFICYRANGQSRKADEVVDRIGIKFQDYSSAVDVPESAAQAWLKFQQNRLEQLRERGEVEQAFDLVEEMIWLNEREGATDKALTADLLTHRSTLLWVRSRYVESVRDIQAAMLLHEQAEEHFNARALKSNLGLVYWTMGALDLAEETLRSSIQFYRETGSEQLLTYDIGNLGLVYFARGELDAALNLTRQHIALAEKINFVHEYHRGRRNLGTILYYTGDYAHSIEETIASHVYYEARGSRDAYGLDVLWLALCYDAQGDRAKALEMVQETLVRAAALHSRVLEQLALRSLAQLLPIEARETPLLRSLDLATAMDRKLEQAAVSLALAEVYTGAHREEQWSAGEAILHSAGADKWLEGRSPENPPFLPLLL